MTGVRSRILLSTWPAHGHLLPMLPLARAAERAGHEVLVVSGAEGVAEARRRGLTSQEVGPSRAQADEAFRADPPDLAAMDPQDRIGAVISGMFGAAAERRAVEMVPLVRDWQPDLVVHPVTETAAAVAAARADVRSVVHGLGPLPAQAWQWFAPRFEELCRRWNVPELGTGILEHPYLDTCPPSLQRDAVADFGRRWPLRPGSGEALPGERLPWSGEQRAALPFPRTVHLTLGTLFHGATEVFETALAGLRRLPVNVLVTVGPGTDPGRLGPQPPHVLVTDFAPHSLVLPHCDLLVTQGGAGTLVAALCHGLPHLVLPQGADQFHNGQTAERAGVARVLLPERFSADAVAELAAQLLDEPGPRAAARAAQAEIETMPTADDVLGRLLAERPDGRAAAGADGRDDRLEFVDRGV